MSFVYFMEARPKYGTGGIGMKIGTSVFPYSRCQAVASELEYWFEMRVDWKIVAMIPGDHEKEAEIHAMLEHERKPVIGREWFKITPAAVERYIRTGTFDFPGFHHGEFVGYENNAGRTKRQA